MITNLFLYIFLFSGFFADVVTTFLCLNNGIVEANPIANIFISSYMFIPIKIVVFIGFCIFLHKSLDLNITNRKFVVFITSLVIIVSLSAVINNTLCLVQLSMI